MRWNARAFMVTKAKFPKDKELYLTDKTFMHLLNLHGFSEEAGFTTLTVKRINIITYYSGLETNYYITLVLGLLENPENFEEVFEEVALKIIDNVSEEKYIEMLPYLFNKILEVSL